MNLVPKRSVPESGAAMEAATAEGAPATARRRGRVFYGWWIVGAGMVMQAMVNLLLGSAFGSYVAILRTEFGWSKTVFSGAYALQQIESGLLGPLQGTLIDKFGPKRTMRFGILLFGLGFMLFSQMHSIVTFYGAFVLVALGGSLSGYFPITVTVVNWFMRRRSTALGFVSAGMAIGGLMAPGVAWFMSTYGWRTAAFCSGLLIMLVGFPITTVMRHKPEDYGQVPDGDDAPQEGGTAKHAPPPDAGFTARQALRTRAFWCSTLGHASALLVVASVNVHLVSFLKEDEGYSVTAGAAMVALVTIFSLTGQVGGGLLGDRLNKRKVVIACMFGHAVALLLLANAAALWMVIVFAIMHGLSWGTRGPLMAAIRADYFGRAAFGAISGYSSLVLTAGTITGPLLAGFLSDQLGNYRIGFIVLAVLAGMGSVFWILATPPRLPEPDAPRSAGGMA